MAAVTAARLATPKRLLGPVRVHLAGDRIQAIERLPAGAPADVDLLAPGFIDLQVNGVDDVDVATAEGTAWARLDRLLASQGVTTWCPTLVSSPLADYPPAFARVAAAIARPERVRPAMAGLHLEGPFLGGATGAHDAAAVLPLDPGWLQSLPPHVRIVTLAPEAARSSAALAGVVAGLVERNIAVSVGHSTASFEQASAAFDAGATLATHLFNGMGPLHHRTPGIVGAALGDDRVTVSMIADLVHVHPAVLQMVFRVKGPGRVALVTDAVAWRAGSAGPVRMALVDGAPRLADGTLAGSALSMPRAVANTVAAGVPLTDALVAATATPAGVLGLRDRGRVVVGARADLVALNAAFEVDAVWIAGREAERGRFRGDRSRRGR
jgi:N-acetylglucosamine-6-phosphate deacetylase